MEYKFELQVAIEEGDLDEFRRLFESGDLDCTDYSGGSLLHSAATFGTVEIVSFLVDAGAEASRPGRQGCLAVTFAAEEGKLDIVRYLVEAGSALDTSHSLRNPLLNAAGEGHIDVVEYLLSTGIDPHATYRIPAGTLINALTSAEQRGHTKIAELLKSHGCHLPVEGVDIPIWEPKPEFMVDQTPASEQADPVTEYMERQFGPADKNGMRELVPVMEGISVGINIIPPNEVHPHMVLYTNGMSDLPMKVPKGQEGWQYAELVMHLPPDWVHPRDANSDPQWLWPVQWLRKMAYYPHLNDTWLGLPSAIVSSDAPPVPLGPNTEQSCLFMVPDFSNFDPPMQRQDGKTVHFFTLVPLYTEERDFEMQHGMDEFLTRFSKEKVPMVVDLDRPNFAKK